MTAFMSSDDLSGLKKVMAAVDGGTASAEDFAEELTIVIRNLEAAGKEGTALYATLKSLFTENHLANLLSAQDTLRDALSPKQKTAKVDEESGGGTSPVTLPKVTIPTRSDAAAGLDDVLKQLEREAAFIEGLNVQIKELSMSGEDFREWELTNVTLPDLMEKTGGARDLVNEYGAAQRAVWEDEAMKAAQEQQRQAMKQQQELYSKLAELSGDWKTALDLQNNAIEQEAAKLREAMPELATHIDLWEKLSKAQNDEAAAATARTADYDARMKELNKDEYYTSHLAGIEQAWLEATNGLDNYRDQMKSTFTDAFSTIQSAGADAFTELFTTGKLEVDSFFANLASQLAAMAAQAAANSIISGIFSSITSSFGSSSGGAVSSIVSSVFHDGGTVGSGGTSRNVPTSVFAGAKRYHSGGFLASDEVPVIAQTGENILSRSDSSNLGSKLDRIATLLASQETSSNSNSGSNIVIVDDQRKVKDYFDSSEGKKNFVAMLNENKTNIQNLSNGGRAG